MAPNSVTSLLLLLAILIFSAQSCGKLEEKKMVLYIQDFSAGPKATVLPVAGVAGKLWTFTTFGTIFCTDEPITASLDRKSPHIGRAQGIFVTSAMDGSKTHVMMSLVFTNKKYNGSTLEIQGNSRQLESVREVAVVGGTGKFRFAKGYATLETAYLDIAISYSVIRCNVTVLYF